MTGPEIEHIGHDRLIQHEHIYESASGQCRSYVECLTCSLLFWCEWGDCDYPTDGDKCFAVYKRMEEEQRMFEAEEGRIAEAKEELDQSE